MIKKIYFDDIKCKNKTAAEQIETALINEIKKTNEFVGITFGCSHTWGYGIDERHTWPFLLNQNFFINAGRPGSSLCSICHFDIKIICKIIDPKTIKYVVIQSPICLRHPWDNKNDVKSHSRIGRFFHLNRKIRFSILKKILIAESNLLKLFINAFPSAKFAYWKYWADYLPLREYNDTLEKEAIKLGMKSFGCIVPRQMINEIILNKHGWIATNQESTYRKKWIINFNDYHPTVKHNKIVARKVMKWIF